MESKIFPAAIIHNTVEVYDSAISVKSRAVYLILLGTLLALLISLPLIYVDVAVQTPGTFQTSLQRNPIINSVGGRLEQWNLSENQKVKKGELLAVVRGEAINLEMDAAQEKLTLLNNFIRDLQQILAAIPLADGEFIRLRSSNYQASLLEFQTRQNNQLLAVQKLERDYLRAQVLFDSKSIAFADYDEVDVQFKQAKAQLEMIRKTKLSEWQQELINHTNEKNRLQNQLQVALEQLDQYKIIAGATGTLTNVINLNEGDFVHVQQRLAEISPDTSLIAVTYMSPEDIAFIQKDQKVQFQIDAYNYNQWGIASGKVIEVADELTLISETRAAFLVTCVLESPTLKLPSGHEGSIKRGMTFNARYVIARRSLFQLLYDKVDNWLNPGVSPKI
jgi:HlyD family secretion protein